MFRSNRKTLLAILFAALVASTQAASVTQLKVLSFNIWVNGSQGLNDITSVIRNSGADIVGLQEADGYAAKAIADQLGFYWIQTGGAGQYATLSRFPIIKRIGETTPIGIPLGIVVILGSWVLTAGPANISGIETS